jgi:hypothetical protein
MQKSTLIAVVLAVAGWATALFLANRDGGALPPEPTHETDAPLSTGESPEVLQLRKELEIAREQADEAEDLAEKLAIAETSMESLQREIDQLKTDAIARAEGEGASEGGSEGEKKSRKVDMRKMMKTWLSMLDNEQMKEQMKQGFAAQVELMYGEFMDAQGLDAEGRKALKELLTDRMVEQMSMMLAMIDEEKTEEEILKLQEEIFGAWEENALDVLRADQMAALTEWEETSSQRMVARQVETTMEGMNLAPDQMEPVRAILLAASEEKEDSEMARMNMDGGSRIWGRMDADEIKRTRESFVFDVDEVVGTMRSRNERVLKELEPVLTPKQHQAYAEQKEQEITMMESAVEMFVGMSGGE